MIAQNKDLEEILAKTRSDYNAKVRYVHVHSIREGKSYTIFRSSFAFVLIVGIRSSSWCKVFKNEHNGEHKKWAKSFGRLSNFAGSREGNELSRVCGETKRQQNKGARIRGTFVISPTRSSVGRASPKPTKKRRAATKFASLPACWSVAQMVWWRPSSGTYVRKHGSNLRRDLNSFFVLTFYDCPHCDLPKNINSMDNYFRLCVPRSFNMSGNGKGKFNKFYRESRKSKTMPVKTLHRHP